MSGDGSEYGWMWRIIRIAAVAAVAGACLCGGLIGWAVR